jgi:hypothetical protein
MGLFNLARRVFEGVLGQANTASVHVFHVNRV